MPSDPSSAATAAKPFRPPKPVVIGILGGIAAGKSAVASRFASHGLVAIDADAISRQVSSEKQVVGEVTGSLGPAVVKDGHLDRPALAALVFADATARAKLEAILHPRIRTRIVAEIARAKANGDSVLLDVPLLLEHGLIAACDHVAFLHTTLATRQARAATRGWTADEHARREAAQATMADKQARASFVIDNDGDLATMHRDVAAMLDQLRPPSS